MWTKIHHRVSDQLMVSHHILQNPTGRTVFICHGWTSGSQRMVGRAQLFLEEGWNVILIDLPGHGESESIPKWNAELSSTLIIEVLNHLHTSHKELFGNPFLIFGHSMGGHGALVTALRNPGRYRSVSAFAPVVAPTQVPWGQKAFTAYLGADASAWKEWDAVELVATAAERLPILVDQGDTDEFLRKQLRPELLEAACQAAGHPLTLRRHAGYDHSYYFIASFIADHFAHHAQAVK